MRIRQALRKRPIAALRHRLLQVGKFPLRGMVAAERTAISWSGFARERFEEVAQELSMRSQSGRRLLVQRRSFAHHVQGRSG